ncbi:SWIM zinc finger family protein [Massilia sp. METH4]|uniref:SWIM zinc finger family protein n=1 Tax=Massilia sp. METH4 TaxID=3123041 RepID=UPI0030D0743F
MLTAEQILALAPDAASAKAGSQLALPAKWGGLGLNGSALWGECQGSGKLPYRTQIDLGEPAFKCSCPSRKFPCKHGLGLYLLRAAQPSLFRESEAPQWVADWLDGRKARREKKEEPAGERSPEAAAAAAAQARKREDKREQNIARGLADLRTWLEDLARDGIVTVRERGPAFWEGMAARMVDVQAGAIGSQLRRLSGLCFQAGNPDWERQLGAELTSLYMLCEAHDRLDTLPVPLQADVRTLVGWSVPRESVLAAPPVADRWQVIAQYTADEGRMRSRTTWLRGANSGRWAMLLHYSVGGQGFDVALPAGTEFDGALCFYPGAWPLRALIKEQSAARPIGSIAACTDLGAALDDYANALAVQPFIDRYPMMLGGLVPDSASRTALVSADGRQLALHSSFKHALHLLALSGGHPLTVFGVWDGTALLPLSVWQGGRLFNIETDFLA